MPAYINQIKPNKRKKNDVNLIKLMLCANQLILVEQIFLSRVISYDSFIESLTHFSPTKFDRICTFDEFLTKIIVLSQFFLHPYKIQFNREHPLSFLKLTKNIPPLVFPSLLTESLFLTATGLPLSFSRPKAVFISSPTRKFFNSYELLHSLKERNFYSYSKD